MTRSVAELGITTVLMRDLARALPRARPVRMTLAITTIAAATTIVMKAIIVITITTIRAMSTPLTTP